MSSMYEYDPELKQYRKKRVGESDAPAAAKGLSLATGETEAALSTGETPQQIERYTPPRRPGGLTVGKVVFWLVFAGLFGGWAYFMYNVIMEDHQKEKNALKAVMEDNEQFEKLLHQPANISIEDVVVEGEGDTLIDFSPDTPDQPLEPDAPDETPLDTSFLEPDANPPEGVTVGDDAEVELRTVPIVPPSN